MEGDFPDQSSASPLDALPERSHVDAFGVFAEREGGPNCSIFFLQ